MSRGKVRFSGLLFGALGIGALLLLWELGHRRYGSLVLPGLDDTFAALLRLTRQGLVGPALSTTTFHASLGWGIGAIIGGGLGVLAGLRTPVRQALQPVSVILLGIPAIAWIVLALLWFGGGWAVIFTVAVATGPVVFAAATQGARSLDGDLAQMARAYRTPPGAMFRDVHGPHMVGYLFPALATALGLSWKIAVMAELLSGSGGIGDGLAAARARVDTAETMAWIVVVVTVLVVVDQALLRRLQRRAELWRDSEETGAP
ncbi:ABC transporter permease subunit [Tropicimonas sp. TH_r6]|uniref:ABC transporter permease n=1 Tax=Tropicimonas sp. TH_r6 TaxID=3082085 RepID=UPI002953C6B0|nr:ABC transporter permease subunit [Tropicimonas sp. TH_r6]MDV7143185.1 ABC transporter permease subunit [Tropicimonas sp. TH_r6]